MGLYRPEFETQSAERLATHQLARLNQLLTRLLPGNRFYAGLLGAQAPVRDWSDYRRLPLTTKAMLVRDQATLPPFGTIATYAPEAYTAYHQTSGTTGAPLAVIDTPESWAWWAECWRYVYAAAGVGPADRIFLAFSFGPFIGFWAAYAGAQALGAAVIPGGGLDSASRLALMARAQATVLVSTPTYALRLAEVAQDTGRALGDLGVRATVHAGEPGASIPAVRDRIEAAWRAACYDHAGGTEVGAYAMPCPQRDGLHLNEVEFIGEVLDPDTLAPVEDGAVGELVLTNLGRPGWPVIRYRTGDLVRSGGRACPCGRTLLKLPGGLLGRADDLLVVRGINIYPSAIEAIVREFDVQEFRIVRRRRHAMDDLLIEVESAADVPARLAGAFRQRLGLRLDTAAVPAGSLPRFEMKARRVVDERSSGDA
ncbi:MAG: AMP-binding protein [Vicinamibacterales bacterium]|nr:AMP-binding protein [Vicinamibacterales bacterium]